MKNIYTPSIKQQYQKKESALEGNGKKLPANVCVNTLRINAFCKRKGTSMAFICRPKNHIYTHTSTQFAIVDCVQKKLRHIRKEVGRFDKDMRLMIQG